MTSIKYGMLKISQRRFAIIKCESVMTSYSEKGEGTDIACYGFVVDADHLSYPQAKKLIIELQTRKP